MKLKTITLLSVVGAISLLIYFSHFLLTLGATKTYSYQLINTYPHDPQAFTQGLIYVNQSLYESTGLRGYSSLRRVELETGKVLQIHNLKNVYFGEGLTLWQNKLIQLTWLAKKGFVYDLETFNPIQEFRYNTEGWGLTHDGQYLIMSDGSENLYYLDPDTFKVVKTIVVTYKNLPLTRLNELEYIEGEIWANIWGSDCVARISPETGKVLAWINLRGLKATQLLGNPDAVLNGIAYDLNNRRIFVTGKLWPHLYEIKLISGNNQELCSLR